MDPSDNACIEVLRPKTVPDGLIALGTVVQISEIQVRLQLTGGVVCIVDRFNISPSFTSSLEKHAETASDLHTPPRLCNLFRRGQQYICRVVERRTRKGYVDAQDIIATLEPSSILENVLPKTLLSIPYVPIQCAVSSIEDYGYQLDIGMKGLSGFLKFSDSEEYCNSNNNGKRFILGQIIRCFSKTILSSEEEIRIIHLTMTSEEEKKSEFTREKIESCLLTQNSILPGSRSFLTVMKVTREGLIVNFMNEFAGFVSLSHLEEEWHFPKENYKISDQFNCTVLYYNHITKTFALTIRKPEVYARTLAYFLNNYYVGKIIRNAEVAYLNGSKSIAFKVHKSHKAVANARDALDEDVSTMTKDELHLALDSAYPDKSKHKCRVKSINLADLILVLSLRKEFMEQPYMSIEEIKAGDFIDATVKKYVKDGIIVSFGLNLRAIILNRDLHDYVNQKSYKRYPLGKTLKCRVLKVDTSKHPFRLYLTNKERLLDKELNIIDSYEKSLKGKTSYATIIKIGPTGLIVELFDNVKGFVPKIFLSSVPVGNIADLFKVGQVISCVVYKADPNRQSLMLGAIPFKEIMKLKKSKKESKKMNKELKKVTGKKSIGKELLDRVLSTPNKPLSERTIKEVTHQTEPIKSRRQRSEEAKLREERLREAENRMLDPDRPPQSILDFERLLLKTPNSAETWIKYSKFFIDNVETEKARIVCRRALKTISFRLEREKLKVWLHLIRIEAKFGGLEPLRAAIEEAAQTNDRLSLYQGTVRVLCGCGELDEAQRLLEYMLKSNGQLLEVWLDYTLFFIEHRKDLEKARSLFDKACKVLPKTELIPLKTKFAQFEFKYGEVERGKTMFENLLSENPKRTDVWRFFEGMIKKYGTRQLDTEEIRQQNQQTLERIAESIDLVSKKSRKRMKLGK